MCVVLWNPTDDGRLCVRARCVAPLTSQDKIVGMLTGNYSSPAITATHMHEAGAGRAGPPRLAFLNPVRRSCGCIADDLDERDQH